MYKRQFHGHQIKHSCNLNYADIRTHINPIADGHAPVWRN